MSETEWCSGCVLDTPVQRANAKWSGIGAPAGLERWWDQPLDPILGALVLDFREHALNALRRRCKMKM